jgi:hypothetical protein
MAHKSRHWKAVVTSDPIGSEDILTVTGEVEVFSTNEEPELAEHHSQGINSILILTLSIQQTSPIGGPVVFWKPVDYKHKVSGRRYEEVTIVGDTEEQTIPVEYILSAA